MMAKRMMDIKGLKNPRAWVIIADDKRVLWTTARTFKDDCKEAYWYSWTYAKKEGCTIRKVEVII